MSYRLQKTYVRRVNRCTLIYVGCTLNYVLALVDEFQAAAWAVDSGSIGVWRWRFGALGLFRRRFFRLSVRGFCFLPVGH